MDYIVSVDRFWIAKHQVIHIDLHEKMLQGYR